MDKWKDDLKDIYYDPKVPGSLSGPSKFRQAVQDRKIPLGKGNIQKWLSTQEDYSTTRHVRRTFERNRMTVAGLDSIWDADLIDLQKLSKVNGGVKYLLLVIDIFSRYVWIRPLKSKEGLELYSAFNSIFDTGRKPSSLRTDGGREFSNRVVSKVYKEYNVHHYTTHNDLQANYAERAIKTIKSRLWRYMRHKKSSKYKDIVQDVVNSYNATIHRSLGRAPNEITPENADESRWDQYLLKEKNSPKLVKSLIKFRFKIGTHVRIPHERNAFRRAYSEQWTPEVFVIFRRFRREGIPVYKVTDLDGDPLEGTFYQDELQQIMFNVDAEFRIEKVLKRRKRRGHAAEIYVKWQSWPSKYNQWIPASEIKSYK